MKITHDLKPRIRYGQTVHISLVKDGDTFIPSTWSGGLPCYLYKGVRYNLGMLYDSGVPKDMDTKIGWEIKCRTYAKATARILDPHQYLDLIELIKQR